MILYKHENHRRTWMITLHWSQFMIGFNWYMHIDDFYLALGFLNIYCTPKFFTDKEPN